MIDFNFTNNAKAQKGSILISEPFLNDNYFSRSVIYLCEHNEEGSFGFILNKFLDTDLTEAIEGFPQINYKVGAGGPVDKSNLFYLHSFGEKLDNALRISGDIYMGGSFDKMKALITDPSENEKNIRFFIGYSGWSQGQLQEELDDKSWLVVNGISKELVMNTDNEEIWRELMVKLGGKFKVMSSFPKNPSDN